MKIKMMKTILVIAGMLVVNSMAGTLKDSRDGITYKTVKIGKQTWMAENLNYKTSESWCYDNKESNCKKYGRLYAWESAKEACPAGWRLPSRGEFETLLANVGAHGGERSKNLRAGSWKNGSDKFGFSALPAGFYNYRTKKFINMGNYTYIWASTDDNINLAYHLTLYEYNVSVYGSSGLDEAFSVRCLKDSNENSGTSSPRSQATPPSSRKVEKNEEPPSNTMTDSRDGKTYKTIKIGDQVWMAENLNYKAGGSMCYDNESANCKKYGRLYTWYAAVDACPAGWHLPSKDEFESLLANASDKESSLNLRAGSWERGKDKFGFSALPAGYYNSSRKKFSRLGYFASFWSSTEHRSNSAYYLNISDGGAGVGSNSMTDGRSVRCLKDSN